MPRRERTLRLQLSDGSAMKVRDYVVAEYGICPGMEIDEKTWEAFCVAAGKASARERAVRIVSASGVSKRELEHRLVQKGEREEDAGEAVQWLSELKLLDDGATAEQLVRSAVNKGYGEAKIKQILFEKRIPEQYWEAALSQVPQMDAAIDAFLEKRFHGTQPDEKERKRAIDALLRRGHSWQDIRAGLQRYGADREDQEEPYE